MTTAAGFPRETMFLALLRGLVAQRLPIFFREHLLTVVTVLVLASLPARIFPRRRLLLPVRSSFSGFGKHWSFSLFPLSLPLPGKRAAAAQLPGARLEWLLLEKKGSYDFRRYLRRFTITREETKADLDSFDYIPYCYGLSRPEKLLFLEPLEYRDSTKIQDLVIAIDTSGSCSLETVSRFLSETLVILSSSENFFKKMNVHLIQCDSAIQSHTVIHSAEEWMENSRKIRILGRGGTDFTPVFSYVKELLEKKELTHLKGLLYFTDGDGIYPTSPPPYETAFVFTDFSFLNYPVPAFITKLCLETNQAGNEVFQYEH